MKKLLGIVVLGLLWCNVGFAEKTYAGRKGTLTEGMSKYQFCRIEWPETFGGGGCRTKSRYFNNGIEVHQYDRGGKKYAIFKNVTTPITSDFFTNLNTTEDWGNGTFYALANSEAEAQKIVNELQSGVTSSNGGSFTAEIATHSTTCKELGFKHGTEKFGDCVLKLIELDIKRGGNDQAAKQFQTKRRDQSSQMLIELGLGLLGSGTTNTQTNTMPRRQNCRFNSIGHLWCTDQ